MASINKNKLFLWAVIISVLNPVFSGLILGLVMLSEPDLRREGKIVAAFSLIWGLIFMLLVNKFKAVLF